MREIWKKTKRFPSYAVSNLGFIKRIRDSHGAIIGNIRKACRNSSGYLEVPLWENGKQYMVYPHHLVMETFVGVRGAGMEINHKDRDKNNNALSNLEYLPLRENRVRGESAGLSKLTESKVRKIRQLSSGGESGCSIARRYGVNGSTVWRVINKNTWAHIA